MDDVELLEKEVQIKKKQLTEISNMVDHYRLSKGAISQSDRYLKSFVVFVYF